MLCLHVTKHARVTVPNHQSLRPLWRLHGGPATLIGSIAVSKPLTASQLRRLPSGLRERIVQGEPA